VDVLGGDLREGLDPVALLERLHGQRVREHRRLQDCLRLGQTLDVVHVGVGGDQRPALGEGEIELPDQLHDLVDVLLEPDVDQGPVPVVVDEIDVAADAPPGLVVHFDHAGKEGPPFEHRKGRDPGRICGKNRGKSDYAGRGSLA
jgi:hypothetical protein